MSENTIKQLMNDTQILDSVIEYFYKKIDEGNGLDKDELVSILEIVFLRRGSHQMGVDFPSSPDFDSINQLDKELING